MFIRLYTTIYQTKAEYSFHQQLQVLIPSTVKSTGPTTVIEIQKSQSIQSKVTVQFPSYPACSQIKSSYDSRLRCYIPSIEFCVLYQETEKANCLKT